MDDAQGRLAIALGGNGSDGGSWRAGAVEVAWSVGEVAGGQRVDAVLRNPSGGPVMAPDVAFVIASAPSRFLEHGYASWSVVRRRSVGEREPGRAQWPSWYLGEHLTVPARAVVAAGEHFLVHDGGVVGFLDGAQHLSVIEPSASSITAVALLDGVTLAPGEERPLDPLWVAAGDPGHLYSQYCTLWGSIGRARAATPVPLGWCSWYQYWGNVTPENIRSNLALAAQRGVELVQIDDGYSRVGDWLGLMPAWEGEGSVGALAAEIGAAGCQAGIWTAPFIAGAGSSVLAEHPDWFVRDARGGATMAMAHPNKNWGGWALALDTTNPAVLDHLRATFARLRGHGYTYHKIDFCYGASLMGQRHDPGATRAQALRRGLAAVRQGAGDDAFVLGCGIPLAPAVGFVDAARVSADTMPYWQPPQVRPGFEETCPAAISAVKASVLRAPMHRRVFANDPDCLMLRPVKTRLSEEERGWLTAMVRGTGSFALLSDDLATYTEREWAIVADIAATRHLLDAPLDLEDPFADVLTVRGPHHALRVDTTDQWKCHLSLDPA